MDRIFPALLAPLCVALAACETRASDDYFLGEISAAMVVTAASDGQASVEATFHPIGDPLVFLLLDRHDALTARIGTRARQMDDHSLLGVVTYEAQFQGVHPESLAEISLTRASDSIAARSAVYIPAAVSQLTPSARQASRGQPLTLSWHLPERQIDGLALTVTGSCIDTYTRALSPDARLVTLPARTLIESSDVWTGAAPATCRIVATIAARRSGTLSPEFGGGSIRALSEASIELTSTP